MNICPKCEKIILSDYKFCPKCGFSLYGEPPHPETCPPPPPPPDDQKESFVPINTQQIRFFNVAQKLSEAKDIDQLLSMIGKAVEELLDADRSAIMLLDETGENLYFKVASGEEILKRLKIPVGNGVAGWIAQEKSTTIVNDPYNDERFSPETDKKTGYKTECIVGAPVMNGDELIGVVEAINKTTGQFTEADVNTLSGFAGLAAVSITNTRLKADQKNFFSNMMDWLLVSSEALGEAEDTETGHTWNMASLAIQMGKSLGLSNDKLQILNRAARLHDIGFLGLNNPQLTGIGPDVVLENDVKFQLHPLIGADMVKSIPLMAELYPFILLHHKHVNGDGFPAEADVSQITHETEIIAILEDYLIKKDASLIDSSQYSDTVYQTFMDVVVN